MTADIKFFRRALLVFAAVAGITGGIGYSLAIHQVKTTECTVEVRYPKKVVPVRVNCGDLDKILPAAK